MFGPTVSLLPPSGSTVLDAIEALLATGAGAAGVWGWAGACGWVETPLPTAP